MGSKRISGKFALRGSLLVAALLGISWQVSLLAQLTTGTILGTVKDQSEAVLPGATVTATNVETGIVRTTTSGSRGEYRIPALAVGTYDIQATMAGFQTNVHKGMTLSIGREAVVDFSLKVGDVAEQVTVTGEAPIIETTTATVSGLVDPQQMREMPLNARSFLDLVVFMPGAVFSDSADNSATKGFGRKLSISGQRYASNSFLLDGADINDSAGIAGSAAGTMAGVETVREFRVVTNAYDAEYGRHTGGVISAITKSGTNQFHGSLFEFLRNDKMDAANFMDNAFNGGEKPSFKRNQFGGSLGGPILKDRTFFFGSYEGLRERKGITSTSVVPGRAMRNGILRGVSIPVSPLIRPYLDAYPVPTDPDRADGTAFFSAAYTRPTNQNYWTTKIDHRFSDSDSVFGRFTFDSAERVTPTENGFNTAGKGNPASRYATVEETHIFSPALLNRTHLSFNRTALLYFDVPIQGFTFPGKFSFSDQADVPGGISVASLTAWGGSSTNPKAHIQNNYQFKEDFFYNTGRHAFKFGGQYERFQFNQRSDFFAGGQFIFDSTDSFLRGDVSTGNFIRPGSDDIRGWRESVIGLYVQDDVSVRPGLNLNLGLRYEFITVPTEANGKVATVRDLSPSHFYTHTEFQTDVGDPYFLNTSLKNFAPRVGIAWTPFGSGKTSLRAGAGFYHDQIMPNVYVTSGVRMPPFFSVAALFRENSQIDFPNAFFSQNEALAKNIGSLPQADGLEYKLNQPVVYKWSFDVEQQVAPGTSVRVGYAASRSVHQVRGNLLLNSNPFTLINGNKFILIDQPLLNPNWARMRWRLTNGTSDYHSFQLSVDKRFSRGFQLHTAYTFARTTDDSTAWTGSNDFGDADRTGYLGEKEHALSAIDIRNSLNTSFVYNLPGGNLTGGAGKALGGWSMSGIVRLSSGYPVSLTADQPRFTRAGVTYQMRFVGGGTLDLAPNGKQNPTRPQNREQYYDVSQFAFPQNCLTAACNPPGAFLGNLGRNHLITPGLANVDFTVTKNTKLPWVGEKANLQFRAEFYNLFNRANFGTPALSVLDRTARLKSNAGEITTTRTEAREIQLALRLEF